MLISYINFNESCVRISYRQLNFNKTSYEKDYFSNISMADNYLNSTSLIWWNYCHAFSFLSANTHRGYKVRISEFEERARNRQWGGQGSIIVSFATLAATAHLIRLRQRLIIKLHSYPQHGVSQQKGQDTHRAANTVQVFLVQTLEVQLIRIT